MIFVFQKNNIVIASTMKPLVFACIVSFPLITLADDTRFHTDPSCWTSSRYFHSGEEKKEIMSQISLSRFVEPNNIVKNRKWVPGPNSVYRFTTAQYTSGRADTNTLLIFIERPYLLRLLVSDGGAI
jgi:hypothetical protein